MHESSAEESFISSPFGCHLAFSQTAEIVSQPADLFVEGVEFEAGFGDKHRTVEAVGLEAKSGNVFRLV
jgi:hypothetical protein